MKSNCLGKRYAFCRCWLRRLSAPSSSSQRAAQRTSWFPNGKYSYAVGKPRQMTAQRSRNSIKFSSGHVAPRFAGTRTKSGVVWLFSIAIWTTAAPSLCKVNFNPGSLMLRRKKDMSLPGSCSDSDDCQNGENRNLREVNQRATNNNDLELGWTTRAIKERCHNEKIQSTDGAPVSNTSGLKECAIFERNWMMKLLSQISLPV